jgi:hypothetical protein
MQLFPKDVVICMEPPFSNVQHALLTSIKYIFRYALPAWEALIGYFDKSADDRKDILDPRLHVTCSWTTNTSLDHESNFGRSAVYLNLTFILGVRSIKGLRDIWEKKFPERDPRGWPRAQEQMTEFDYLCEKLQAIRVRFQQHHKNITALRDDLFSASAVKESQASTRLGGQLEPPLDRTWLTNTENVRLLAFVSIFFLPLPFCTSLWSMSDSLFPLHVLIYVIVLVAFATYMVVFNLDALVRLFTNTYESHRNSLVDKMKLEVD